MPGRTDSFYLESGRSTAPPGVNYTQLGPSRPADTATTLASTSQITPTYQLYKSPSYNQLTPDPHSSPRYLPSYQSPTPGHVPKYTHSPFSYSAISGSKTNTPKYTPTYSSYANLSKTTTKTSEVTPAEDEKPDKSSANLNYNWSNYPHYFQKGNPALEESVLTTPYSRDSSKIYSDFDALYQKIRCAKPAETKRKKHAEKSVVPEVKREVVDEMSGFQDEKSLHKNRQQNYGDYNQWDYLNSREGQGSLTGGRRGHLPFAATAQGHGMSWNPMNMGLPHQGSPYYNNPHLDRGHVMPAHAHTGSDYNRYNQWSNSSHKLQRDIQNAHSQRTVLPQQKLTPPHDTKPQPVSPIKPPTPQEFTVQTPQEFSKVRTSPHDLVQRTPPATHQDIRNPPLLSLSEYPHSISPTLRNPNSVDFPSHPLSPSLRNPPSLRTPPPVSVIPKPLLGNPLSNLQMLVTNQETAKDPQSKDSYQDESVDLSAHSESNRNHKEVVRNGEECEEVSKSSDIDEQIEEESQIAKTNLNTKENDKPVELISKSVESSESEKLVGSDDVVEDTKAAEVESKSIEEPTDQLDCTEIKDEQEAPESTESNFVDAENVDSSKTMDDDEIEKELALLDGNCQKDEEVNENREVLISEEVETLGKKDSDGRTTPIEAELEKMLAGIEDAKDQVPEPLPTVSSTSVDIKPTPSSKKRPVRKRPPRRRTSRLSSGNSTSPEPTPPSKKKKIPQKEEKPAVMKKKQRDLLDTSRRGPILHVEGTRDNPLSVYIIDCPKGEDEDEKDRFSSKKVPAIGSRKKLTRNENDFRGKSRNGLFSSTLSSRYDAHSTDPTWVCVFCKRGPHFRTLGDLFGPYVVPPPPAHTALEFSGDEKDIVDAQMRGGRNKKSLRSNNMLEHFQKMSKKLKRTHTSEAGPCKGLMPVRGEESDSYEVWTHEGCLVWSDGVFNSGGRVLGLDDSIWACCRTMCSKCGEMGANIGCLRRNCANRAHYMCAKDSAWDLNEDTFVAICQVHKPRS